MRKVVKPHHESEVDAVVCPGESLFKSVPVGMLLRQVALFSSLILLTTLLSCSLEMNTGNSQLLHFVNVEEVWFGDVEEPQTVVFKDSTMWLAFGDKYGFRTLEPFDELPPMPANFDQSMVIGIFWGARAAGCMDRVEAIKMVTRYSDHLEVEVGKLPFLGPCQMVVYPFQLVKITSLDVPVEFTGEVPE